MNIKSSFKAIGGFLALFGIYHWAEFMVLYRNSPIGFLGFSALFFVVAALIGKWQFGNGLKAWGLVFNKRTGLLLAAGLLIGLTVNGITFLTSLYCHIEVISFVPEPSAFLKHGALLVFGCCISSLTEDVLTRGYVYCHLHEKMSPSILILFSAAIYVLNHIHRLDEPVYIFYLFVIGIHLMIPMLFTGNIWYTLGVHWAGNIVYHITNNVMHTEEGKNHFPGLVLMLLFMLLLIPINYIASKKLTVFNTHMLSTSVKTLTKFVRLMKTMINPIS